MPASPAIRERKKRKKTTYKEVTETSGTPSKNLKSKSKKIIYDVVKTSLKNLKVS